VSFKVYRFHVYTQFTLFRHTVERRHVVHEQAQLSQKGCTTLRVIIDKFNASSLCVLSDIKSAIIVGYLSICVCLRSLISRRRWHRSAWNFCMMVHIGPGHNLPSWGRYPQEIPKFQIVGLNFGHLTTNVSKTVGPRSQHCTPIRANISSTGPFYKCIA